MKRSLVAALVAAALAPAAARADPADLLAPGSRPAPGLGGDPFASPLRDAVGWWSRAASPAGGGAGVRFEASRLLPATGRGAPSLDRSEWRAFAGYERPVGRRSLRLSIVRSDPGWSAGAGGGQGAFRGAGAEARAGVDLRLAEALPGLTLAAATRGGAGAGREDAGVGARFLRDDWLAAQVSWERAADRPEVALSDGDARIVLPLDLPREISSADLEVRGGPLDAAQLGYHRMLLLPPAFAAHAAGHEFALGGEFLGWQSAAIVRPAAGLRLLLRRTEARGLATADGRWLGQRYARVPYARGRLTSWLGAIEGSGARHRLLADVERLEASGGARGSVESWPFTDLWGDLLGVRQHALARLECEGWRAHAGIERVRESRLGWRAGAAGYDLRTEGSLIGWQSVFLGLGVANRRESGLAVRRIQLGSVSIGATLRAAGLETSADLRQFVFAKLFRGDGAGGSGAGGEGPAGPAAGAPRGRERGWPGGTSFSVAVRLGR